MLTFRAFVLALLVSALVAAPTLAKGGGGGGGGAGAGAGNGNGNGAAASAGGGNGAGHGMEGGAGTPHGMATGAGRGTALTAPGSQHRSSTASQRLSNLNPGNAQPRSGVVPGMGRVGTVPTTPGRQSP
jgi:hypothetical protein